MSDRPAPDIIERQSGGYLAVSPRSFSLRIGVTAATREDAEQKWYESLAKWQEIRRERLALKTKRMARE